MTGIHGQGHGKTKQNTTLHQTTGEDITRGWGPNRKSNIMESRRSSITWDVIDVTLLILWEVCVGSFGVSSPKPLNESTMPSESLLSLPLVYVYRLLLQQDKSYCLPFALSCRSCQTMLTQRATPATSWEPTSIQRRSGLAMPRSTKWYSTSDCWINPSTSWTERIQSMRWTSASGFKISKRAIGYFIARRNVERFQRHHFNHQCDRIHSNHFQDGLKDVKHLLGHSLLTSMLNLLASWRWTIDRPSKVPLWGLGSEPSTPLGKSITKNFVKSTSFFYER